MLRDVWDGHSEAYQSAPRRISLQFQRKRSIQFSYNANTAQGRQNRGGRGVGRPSSFSRNSPIFTKISSQKHKKILDHL